MNHAEKQLGGIAIRFTRRVEGRWTGDVEGEEKKSLSAPFAASRARLLCAYVSGLEDATGRRCSHHVLNTRFTGLCLYPALVLPVATHVFV